MTALGRSPIALHSRARDARPGAKQWRLVQGVTSAPWEAPVLPMREFRIPWGGPSTATLEGLPRRQHKGAAVLVTGTSFTGVGHTLATRCWPPGEPHRSVGRYSLTTSAQMQGRCALPLPPPSGPAPSKGRNRGASRLARNRRQHALNGNVDQTHGHALPRDFLIPGARLPRLARLDQLEKSAPREVGGWRAP